VEGRAEGIAGFQSPRAGGFGLDWPPNVQLGRASPLPAAPLANERILVHHGGAHGVTRPTRWNHFLLGFGRIYSDLVGGIGPEVKGQWSATANGAGLIF
jgi:hypothetical protein